MKPDELKALVTEGAALSVEIAEAEKKRKRLDEIKDLLREAAGGNDAEFFGEKGEIAAVKKVANSICRSVPVELEKQALKLSGEHFHELFRLAPGKNFELNALKLLPKKASLALVELCKVPSTPHVKFLT